jgi:hypothetical protein
MTRWWGVGTFLLMIVFLPVYLVVRGPRLSRPPESAVQTIQPHKSGHFFRNLLLIGASGFGFLFVLGIILNLAGYKPRTHTAELSENNNPPATSERPEEKGQSMLTKLFTPNVTMDKFEQLETGMSYRQVKQIIGSDGEELSRGVDETQTALRDSARREWPEASVRVSGNHS